MEAIFWIRYLGFGNGYRLEWNGRKLYYDCGIEIHYIYYEKIGIQCIIHVYQKSGNYVVICLFFKSSVVEINSWKSKIDNTIRNSYYKLPKRRLWIWIFPIIICNIWIILEKLCGAPTPDNEEEIYCITYSKWHLLQFMFSLKIRKEILHVKKSQCVINANASPIMEL